MPDLKLPSPELQDHVGKTLDGLIDTMMQYKKTLEYVLLNLDDTNIISADFAKIKNVVITDAEIEDASISAAKIEELIVGDNVTMGENATIAWGKVTSIPTDIVYDDTLTTVLGQDYVVTGKIYANQLTIEEGYLQTAWIEDLIVGENVAMGSNATISWNKVTSKPSDIIYEDDLTTELGQDYVMTGKIYANQITGGEFQALDRIIIGSLGDYITRKYLYFDGTANISAKNSRMTLNADGIELGGSWLWVSSGTECLGYWDFTDADVTGIKARFG